MENFISGAVSVFEINGLVIGHLTKYNSKGEKCMRVSCKLPYKRWDWMVKLLDNLLQKIATF